MTVTNNFGDETMRQPQIGKMVNTQRMTFAITFAVIKLIKLISDANVDNCRRRAKRRPFVLANSLQTKFKLYYHQELFCIMFGQSH